MHRVWPECIQSNRAFETYQNKAGRMTLTHQYHGKRVNYNLQGYVLMP